MIDSQIRTADASGTILEAGGRGVGFRLRPGGSRPGTFPVRIRFDDGREVGIVHAGPHWIAGGFQKFDILNALPRGEYSVGVMRELQDAFGNAEPTRAVVALATVTGESRSGVAAPAAATDGVELLPTFKTWQAYFGGVLGDVALWVRSIGGTWYLAETVASTDLPVLARSVAFGGGRLYFQLAVGMTLDSLDVEVER